MVSKEEKLCSTAELGTRFVPLGVDCGVATSLKQLKLRQEALPFDWVVVWSPGQMILNNDVQAYFNNCNFAHHDANNLTVRQTLQKRWNRLQNLINTDVKLVFVHKGHAQHHHTEKLFPGNTDVHDMHTLALWLDAHHPNYQIWSWHCCDLCSFQGDQTHPKVSHQNATLHFAQSEVDVHNLWHSYYDIFHEQFKRKVRSLENQTKRQKH